MQQGTTTVRVSRRTHAILTDLARAQRRSVSDLLDQLAERARRQAMLDQYNARMAEVLADADECAAWQAETARSELSAAEASSAGNQAEPR